MNRAGRLGHATYQLTQTGKSLRPVLGALRDWGLANIRGTRALIAAADGTPIPLRSKWDHSAAEAFTFLRRKEKR